jgi:hypothetical protein
MGEGGYPHEEVGAKFIEEVGSRITRGSKAPSYRSKQMLHGFPHSEWSQIRRQQKRGFLPIYSLYGGGRRGTQ